MQLKLYLITIQVYYITLVFLFYIHVFFLYSCVDNQNNHCSCLIFQNILHAYVRTPNQPKYLKGLMTTTLPSCLTLIMYPELYPQN